MDRNFSFMVVVVILIVYVTVAAILLVWRPETTCQAVPPRAPFMTTTSVMSGQELIPITWRRHRVSICRSKRDNRGLWESRVGKPRLSKPILELPESRFYSWVGRGLLNMDVQSRVLTTMGVETFLLKQGVLLNTISGYGRGGIHRE